MLQLTRGLRFGFKWTRNEKLLTKPLAFAVCYWAVLMAQDSTYNKAHHFLHEPRSLYRVAHNKIPHQTICNISTISGPILKILEAA